MSSATAIGQATCCIVNAQTMRLTIAPQARLSDALRTPENQGGAGLTGTKVGCHAGDCGACTVLISGNQACSCLVPLGQVSDAEVLTVEGLASTPLGMELQQAFIAAGAAQCGICTPGMLMAAYDTLVKHPQPTRAEVLDGLGGVLCRCTGYTKIVEAVLLAAQASSNSTVNAGSITQAINSGAVLAGQAVGASVARLDAHDKVTGRARYGADEMPPDALMLKVFRSPLAHARIEIGDLQAWIDRHPGLAGVVTPRDIKINRFAIFPDLRDQPALAEGVVRFRGEAVIVVVGEPGAVGALDFWVDPPPVRFHPLEVRSEIADALQATDPVQDRWPDNVLCRGRVVRGEVDSALAWSLEQGFGHFQAMMTTQHVEHAYIEPEAGWAKWDCEAERQGADNCVLTVFVTTQTPYMDRDELANMFGLQPRQVRIIPSAVGGGFGGKLDMSVQPLIVAAARKFGRPAVLIYDRPESMVSSTKRHPATMQASLAMDAQGNLLAYDFSADFNTGAYSSWGPTVANRVPIHASGPYRVQQVRALTRAVLTNNAVAGAFRGFGVPQSTLLNERLIDEAAHACGQDPLEFRHQHALRAGDLTPTGQRLEASVGLQACLDALRPAWGQALARCASFNAQSAVLKRGVGIACMWYGIGNTVIANPSTMTLGLKPDGGLVLYNGAIDIGQGTYTIMMQMAADALGVPMHLLQQVHADTALTEDAGKSSASRQTFVSGNAARFAGLDLKRQLAQLAWARSSELPALDHITIDVSKLSEGEIGVCMQDRGPVWVKLAELPVDAKGHVLMGSGSFNPPTIALDADGQGVPYATYGFAAQFAHVEVDCSLGLVRVLDIHAAHDVGRAINPAQVEGQIQGGIAQGLGLALMEEYISGRTDNLHDYLIPTVGDMPAITIHLIEDPEPLGPWGAKGVGEPALCATAPAILNAIHAACGVRMNEVPVTPTRLLTALNP
jgi:aldehyde oxidoreductase